MKITINGLWQVLKESFNGFMNNRVLKLSAALAYYTVFSIAPLLIVIVYLCSFFFGREAVQGNIYMQIQGFVGHDAAIQLQEIIKNATIVGKGNFAAIIGVATLLIGATGMFTEMQDSINIIWKIKTNPQSAIWLYIKNRLLSFGVIGALGFLLLVSLIISGLIEALNLRLQTHFPAATITFFYIMNLAINFVVIAVLFSVIFRVLPDASIKWKDVMAGAVTTAFLFMLGKFAISFYITRAKIGSTYGTAGSLVILLIWVYYSSVILYFGAEFTRAYALRYGEPIVPDEYAVMAENIEIEHDHETVQEAELKKD